MSYSEVKIANIALTEIGESPIVDFSSENERARRCDMLFPISRDYVLRAGDWTFARKTVQLQELTTTHPRGKAFKMPSDCLMPRKVYPRGSQPATWEVEGRTIIVPTTLISSSSLNTLYLVYTRFETNIGYFTIPFITAVAADLSARLVWPFTHDKDAAKAKREQAEYIIGEMLMEDANIGSQYRHPNEDPDNDRFVNPDAGQVQYYGTENSSS